MKQKLSEVLGSQNAFVSVITMITIALTANDIILGQSPEEIYNLFVGKNAGQIVTVLLLHFFNPLVKIVKKFADKQWTWAWVKSSNFVASVVSLASIIIGSFLGEETAGMLVALVVQIYNFIKHLLEKPTQEQPTGEGNQQTDPQIG